MFDFFLYCAVPNFRLRLASVLGFFLDERLFFYLSDPRQWSLIIQPEVTNYMTGSLAIIVEGARLCLDSRGIIRNFPIFNFGLMKAYVEQF